MKQFHIRQSLFTGDLSLSAEFAAYAMSEFSHNQCYMPCFSLEAFSQWLTKQGCSEKRLQTILLGWNELLENGYIVKLHKFHGECSEIDLSKLNNTLDSYFYLEPYGTTTKFLKLKAQNWLDLFKMYLVIIGSMHNPSKCNPLNRGKICFMPQEYLANSLNTTTRTISRWTKALIDSKILYKNKSKLKHSGHYFNIYSRISDKDMCFDLANMNTGTITENISNYTPQEQPDSLM